MKLTAATGLLAALSSLTAAAPTSPSPDAAPSRFILKTVAVGGDKYEGLYVNPAFASPGYEIAVVEPLHKNIIPSYFKNGSVFFNFGKGAVQQYALGTHLDTSNEAWGLVTISQSGFGYGPAKGLHVNATNDYLLTGAKHDPAQEKMYEKLFQGAYWRVCEWNNGRNQLFFNYAEVMSSNPHPKSVPSNCGLVNLKVIPH